MAKKSTGSSNSSKKDKKKKEARGGTEWIGKTESRLRKITQLITAIGGLIVAPLALVISLLTNWEKVKEFFDQFRLEERVVIEQIVPKDTIYLDPNSDEFKVFLVDNIEYEDFLRFTIKNRAKDLEDVTVTVTFLDKGCLIGAVRAVAYGGSLGDDYLLTDTEESTKTAKLKIKKLPKNAKVEVIVWLARGSRCKAKRNFEIEVKVEDPATADTFQVFREPKPREETE